MCTPPLGESVAKLVCMYAHVECWRQNARSGYYMHTSKGNLYACMYRRESIRLSVTKHSLSLRLPVELLHKTGLVMNATHKCHRPQSLGCGSLLRSTTILAVGTGAPGCPCARGRCTTYSVRTRLRRSSCRPAWPVQHMGPVIVMDASRADMWRSHMCQHALLVELDFVQLGSLLGAD